MKKQVALLLAAVMTISLLPVSAMAATNNYVDNRLTVPDASAIVEHNIGGSVSLSQYLMPKGSGWTGDPNYYVDGTDLVIPLQRDVQAGYQFRLTLNNAKWYFRQNAETASFDSTRDVVQSAYAPGGLYGGIANWSFMAATNGFPSAASTSPAPLYTYDTNKGVFFPVDDNNAGTYFRNPTINQDTYIGGVVYKASSYKLEVSTGNQSVAVVTITDNYAGDNYYLRIPLVTYISDSNVEATVTIDPGNSSTVTAQKIIFANTAEGKTNSTIGSVKVGRDVINLDTFTVNELRVGTIQAGEIIELSLPAGWHFTDPNSTNVKVGVENGLAWTRTSKDGYGIPVPTSSAVSSSAFLDGLSTGKYDYAIVYGQSNYYNDKLGSSGYYSNDDSTLWIYLGGVNMSTQLRGSVYVDGLQIWADDSAPMPANGKLADIIMHVKGANNITEQDVTIAQRTDWALMLKTLNAIPTLVSGRYIGPSWDGTDADDNTHRTADVQLKETSANSWWGARTTVLALPATDNSTVKGAKFRKVVVDDFDQIANPLKDRFISQLYSSGMSSAVPKDSATYLNDNERHGAICVNDNTITISNLTLNNQKTSDMAYINFHLWVSVEYGYGAQSGDLTLSVDPSTTSLTGSSYQNLPSVVIAHVVDPVKVTTQVSDLKIGYQYQTTADIQIQENGAGYLLAGKTVKVSISDLISSDMYFTNDIKVAVTSGDLRIKNVVAAGQGGFTSQSKSWLDTTTGTGTMSFDIDRVSTVASTITISNVAVKLDRTVPVTNKSAYQAVVWGTAIAENYGLVDNIGRTWKADFNTAGTFLPYINVISAPNDKPEVLSQEVRVTIGENYYTVNGQTYSMDAAAYISPASNSTMVPVRFVANAFGLRDDQILWDDTSKTCTITAPNKVIQFKLDSSTMVVNGVPITMNSPDGLPVVAEIKTINGLGRMYLPFRALGNAFGVPVDWAADTQTAIYNKGANTNANASVSNNNPTVTP